MLLAPSRLQSSGESAPLSPCNVVLMPALDRPDTDTQHGYDVDVLQDGTELESKQAKHVCGIPVCLHCESLSACCLALADARDRVLFYTLWKSPSSWLLVSRTRLISASLLICLCWYALSSRFLCTRLPCLVERLRRLVPSKGCWRHCRATQIRYCTQSHCHPQRSRARDGSARNRAW